MRARILIISDYGWETGGTEEFVRALLSATFVRHEVELLTWASSRAPMPPDIEVSRVDHGDVLSAWRAMARADAIVVVTSFNVRMLARLTEDILANSDKPVITVVQTSAHSSPGAASQTEQENWLRGLMLRSRIVVGASEAVYDGLEPLVRNVRDAPPIVTIENGARLVDLRPHSRNREQVLFIGRPVDSKGYPSFLRLVDALEGSGIRFAANTVSIDPEVIDPRVTYSRCLDDAGLVRLFAETDLVVAPYWRADGLPLALLEALNCGVPLVGFDSPAVGPLLRRYDQLVLPCDTSALIHAVKDWRVGTLDLRGPAPGQVPTLFEQADAYVALVDRILEAELQQTKTSQISGSHSRP